MHTTGNLLAWLRERAWAWRVDDLEEAFLNVAIRIGGAA